MSIEVLQHQWLLAGVKRPTSSCFAVVLACRSKAKGTALKAELEWQAQQEGRHPPQLEVSNSYHLLWQLQGHSLSLTCPLAFIALSAMLCLILYACQEMLTDVLSLCQINAIQIMLSPIYKLL